MDKTCMYMFTRPWGRCFHTYVRNDHEPPPPPPPPPRCRFGYVERETDGLAQPNTSTALHARTNTG
eukprot:gene1068-4299_t